MSRQFRDQPVVKWVVIDSPYKDQFQKEINTLMDGWSFIDCQFSTYTINNLPHYVALILLANR